MRDLLPRDAWRGLPMARYEYVDVTFGAANTDHVVPYTTLKPTDLEDVRWLDITPNSASATIPVIYRSTDASRKGWGVNYLVLRCTVASYTTRLLLFLERD